jgi:predicted RNase H-like nuclease (RuvC/YqgF family)
MKIRSFTKQKIEELEKEIKNLKNNIKKITDTTESEMWISDLEEFEKAYNSWLNTNIKKYKLK